jgi:uncharacterized phage infection (PIP) family protein YhgE
MKEQTGISSSKANVTTHSNEMVSQNHEVSNQIITVCSQALTSGRQLSGLVTQSIHQCAQLSELNTQLVASNKDLDALKDQLCDRDTKLSELIAETMYLSGQRSRSTVERRSIWLLITLILAR